MTWQRKYCSAINRNGKPCANLAPDGRGGFCAVHRARYDRDMQARRRGEPKPPAGSTWNDAMSDSPAPRTLSASADLEARDE